MRAGRRKASHFRLILLAPVLALVALSAWAFASPMGASPDDDYHLVSIWCSTGNEAFCQPGRTDNTRMVPNAVLESQCYAFRPITSASCQNALDFESSELVETDRGNFVGAYPPVYYSAMSVFVGENTLMSVMAMRLFNIFLFVGIASALYILLPFKRRSALVWGWLITTMPLGLFLIASNNPSGWAITGVGTAWLALLGFYESTKRANTIALGAFFVLAVVMAAGSRGDAALYVAGAMGVSTVLAFERSRRFLVRSALPLAMLVVSAAFFLTSRQTASGLSGFSGGSSMEATAEQVPGSIDSLAGFGLFAYNLFNVPSLWTGVFGGWGLGWIDTRMPALVLVLGVAVFIGVGFAGLSVLDGRKAFVVAGVGFVLWALPTYVLTQGGDRVGEQVQPRYLLPLIVLLGGLLVLRAGRKRFTLGRIQSTAVVLSLSVAYVMALHTNMRRYVTGIDVYGWNLDAGTEWFWSGAPSPVAVWAIGSAAFAGLVFILAREMSISAASAPEIDLDEKITLSASR
ncbi:putative membrane protein DUF2142 [Rhodoglobus vestalii]|uniref:Putative membrane protein DUF2142 n=1 Tax=Rhodoglobus vestalii TaxID=193384 RepID=A0A8H2K8D1_9MICO|nr:DUF2142 domain-containing protein [Rhodoglobus vestalii]TQO20757.1 putative membrane protein DUF2142 [Rhodoglobus vestalii]